MTTRDQLQRALERFDSDATVSVEGGISLLATVTSASFAGLNEALRQQLVWRHLRAEFDESLDQNGGLDRHVQRSGDAHAFERLGFRVFFANCHEAGHFVLGDGDFLATPLGERDVGDDIVGALGRGGRVFGEVGSRGGEFSEDGCRGGFG